MDVQRTTTRGTAAGVPATMALIDYGGLLPASLLRKCSPAMPGSSCDLAQRRIRKGSRSPSAQRPETRVATRISRSVLGQHGTKGPQLEFLDDNTTT